MTSYRWHLAPDLPADHPLQQQQLPPLMRQLLYNRGILDAVTVKPFLDASASLQGDPLLLPDIQPALTRIYRALLGGEHIAVYGDFDVDGITSTALLVQGLTALGGQVTPYIPHRLQEGHGLNSFALNELKEHGATLIITVDCGVTGAEQVKKLSRSVDIIITDHHLPVGELPAALAVIDPQREDSRYPFKDLAGVGVAYKLLQALYQGMGRPPQAVEDYLDLVALGTVADMMPLSGENRYLVTEGLRHLRDTRRLGLQELVAQSGLTLEKLEAGNISWALAPRLNAAGRLEHAISGYQLLVTGDAGEARAIAQKLGEMNSERQRLTTTAMAQAREQVLAKGLSPLLVVSNAECPGGILGLVAGRLVDEFYHPAVVIQVGEETSHGSSRSTPDFNITRAIEQCSDLVSHFGGHAQAAGFTFPTKNLSQIEAKLSAIAAAELAGRDLRPQLDIDCQVKFHDLNGATYLNLQRLAPFGQGNPTPLFLSRAVKVVDYRTMGNSGQHLRLRLKQGSLIWDAVAFGL
ncbi:MAG TPA: single-stranded-DNA-specific exonuclease RecJ, partial [bacterium]|nr:single-stranded-DNA-specific exonuclease RecJ [bacterium]